MRVLVTGGSGFIGTSLVARFLDRNDRVTVLDLIPPAADQAARVHYVQGDVRDPQCVARAMTGAGLVIHLAAAHHDFGISEATFFSVNEGGAEVLTGAMIEANVQRACFYSSVAVYGAAPEPRTEEVRPVPLNAYGDSKLAGERVFRRWAEGASKRQAIVIRPTMTFGPGNFANMYSLIRQVHRRMFLQVGAGQNGKSIAYVDNLVDATLFLVSQELTSAFNVYNYVDLPIPTSSEISNAVRLALGRNPARLNIPLWLALAVAWPLDVVARMTGKNLPITAARIRKLAGSRTVYSGEKLEVTGFRAKVSVEEGIRRMVEWYLQEGHALPVERRIPPASQSEQVGQANRPSDGRVLEKPEGQRAIN